MRDMRSIINLVENAQAVSEETLFRGDSSAIAAFDFEKTDRHALFGRGIYLTDSPKVAADYTVKASEHVICQARPNDDEEPAESAQAIVGLYLRRLMTEMGWATDVANLKSHLQSEFYRGNISQGDINARYIDDARKITTEYLKKARAAYKAQADDLRVVKNTTGEFIIVKKDREGYITSFEIPDEYLTRFLPGDAPLPDHALKAIKDLFEAGQPGRKLDMRDADNNFCSFDEWHRAYNTTGVGYAWEGTVEKGPGNPSFDLIRNGTFHGGGWFYNEENETAFIRRMQELGYVGIEYDGGKRVGAHVRGGGGVRHRAYVFWDGKALEHFRKGSERVEDAALGAGLESRVRSTNRLYAPR